MRPFLCGVLVWASVFCLAGGHEPKKDQVRGALWRRTSAGWENMHHWQTRSDRYHPTLHPSTVAGFQFLACLLVLVAWDGIRFPKSSCDNDLWLLRRPWFRESCTDSAIRQHYYSQSECLSL